MGSGNGGSGAPIPEDALPIIRDIKSTTGMQYTDEDVYAILKQCAMDPNETAQKLLYLDTFQVFKSKREKKREIAYSKVSQRTSYHRGQWARGNLNFSSKNGYSGGVRNLPAQRENRGNGFPDRASGPASSQQIRKDTTVTNGMMPSTNGVSVSGPAKTPSLKDLLLANLASTHVGIAPLPSGNSVNKKVSNKSKQVEKAEVPQLLKPSIVKETAKKDNGVVKEASVPIEVLTSGVASMSVESVDSQSVTFPDHFVVVTALTNGLTFGSFGASCIDDVIKPTAQPSQGSNGSTEESSPSNQAGDVVAVSQPWSLVQDESNCRHAEPKSNAVLPTPEDSENNVVQDGQHTFDILSSTSSGQTESCQLKSQDLSYLVAPTDSSPSPTTPKSSSPLSPPPPQIAVLRQAYPLGYMPYGGHYLTPLYMHQMLLGHNGYAQQQPAAGNMYLSPTMAAQQGLKLPMYKPCGYNSVYGPTSVGYSASPTSEEDLAASQLKEKHDSSAPLGDAPPAAAMWIPPQGQDLNSVYNLNLPQGRGVQQPHQTNSGGVGLHSGATFSFLT